MTSALVLFWDEVPYMIDNIRQREGEKTAAEVLDTLRSLRQTHSDFRMVFTGSIGLHHVLTHLNDAHLATEPVNDMYPIEVTPLAPNDAKLLAVQLLQGEKIAASDQEAAAEAIAEHADFFPFYVHHIVRCLKMNGTAAELDRIEEAVKRQLTDANDPWELAHYRKRINVYYGRGNDADLVHCVLDSLTNDAVPATVTEIFNRIQGTTDQHSERNRLLDVLRLMERDHYLSRTLAGEYQFRFPLIRRWWRLDRGL